jgi:hypothetical protein
MEIDGLIEQSSMGKLSKTIDLNVIDLNVVGLELLSSYSWLLVNESPALGVGVAVWVACVRAIELVIGLNQKVQTLSGWISACSEVAVGLTVAELRLAWIERVRVACVARELNCLPDVMPIMAMSWRMNRAAVALIKP